MNNHWIFGRIEEKLRSEELATNTGNGSKTVFLANTEVFLARATSGEIRTGSTVAGAAMFGWPILRGSGGYEAVQLFTMRRPLSSSSPREGG